MTRLEIDDRQALVIEAERPIDELALVIPKHLRGGDATPTHEAEDGVGDGASHPCRRRGDQQCRCVAESSVWRVQTIGLGSVIATTTSAIPASIRASAQGPVRP